MKLRFVENAPFFSALSEEEQERVSERMHLEHRRGGEMLFQKDAPSNALYLIKSGWVRLVADGGTAMASQGPGSLVGETDLFLDRPRSHGATLATDTELWVLDKADLIELIAESPQLGLKLTLAFGTRLALFDQYLVKHRLKPLPYLSGLDDEALTAIARRLVPTERKEGEFIVEGGQPPEALFIVESGRLHLHSSEEGGDFSELGTGETFGEMAVLTGKAHARTAQAATDVILWALPAAEFDALAEQHPEVRMALSKAFREPLLSQDQERAVDRLSTMTLFEGLSEEVLWAVSERLLLRHVPANELVFAKGSPGDALYLIDSGQIEIIADDRLAGRAVLARLGADDFFGEMALLTGKPRSTAAKAATHTNLWVLYRSDFDDLVNRHPSISMALSRVLSERLAGMDRRFTESHLRGLKLLAGLSASQLEDVSRRLKPVRFRQGETIVREGDPGEEMYFIESGRVRVVRGSGPNALLLAEMGAGDLFGEMALLTNSPRSATVTALSDLDLWAMPQADFDDLVTAYPNLALALSRLLSERLRNTDERFLKKPAAVPPRPRPRPAPQPMRVARPAPKPKPRPKPKPAPRPVKTRPVRRKPARSLTSELSEAFGGLVTWFGGLSRGAKIRLVLFTMLLAWLLFVVTPVLVIQTLAADDVTNLQGAIAFVQTVPPAAGEGSLSAETPMPSVVRSVAPAAVPEPGQVVSAEPEQAVAAEAPQAGESASPEALQAEQGASPEALQAEQAVAAESPASPPDPPPSANTEAGSGQPPPTPTPWIIVITNTPAPPTDTPVPPTDTPVPPPPTQAPARKVETAAKPAATATPSERPQPPRDLDPRLAAMGVVVQPVGVRPGQSYWRLIAARWEDEAQAGGGHSIYIDVRDEGGNRLLGQPVEIRWASGSLTVPTEAKPPNEFPANFAMYNTLGSYSVSIAGLPSDVVVGMGLGTAAQPKFTIHTNFFLTFQRVTR